MGRNRTGYPSGIAVVGRVTGDHAGNGRDLRTGAVDILHHGAPEYGRDSPLPQGLAAWVS